MCARNYAVFNCILTSEDVFVSFGHIIVIGFRVPLVWRTSMEKRISSPRIFISYAHEDRELVERLYQQLCDAGFQPWMDDKNLLPGEIWMDSIRSAIEESDFFLFCLSHNSIYKRGVLQKEFKSAREVWQGMLDSDIYLIPVRLENCDVPGHMAKFQWVDLFEKHGFSRLEKAIQEGMKRRANGLRLVDMIPDEEQPPAKPSSRPPTRISGTMGRLVTIALGLFGLFGVVPWIYNNYFFRVENVTLPATCQPASAPVRVAIAELRGCSTDFENALMTAWSTEFVSISAVPQPGVADFDLIVNGACEPEKDPAAAQLNFRLNTSRAPYEVFEPKVLSTIGTLAELSKIGEAMIRYQHGDYVEASRLFGSLAASQTSGDLDLFAANSWLLAERYEEAIDSYNHILRAVDPDSAAAYNNLGVALGNTERPTDDIPYSYHGLDEFGQAIKLAHERQQPDLELLAYVNRAYLYRQGNSWVNALADCNAALKLDAKSALPQLCLASHDFSYYIKPERLGLLPFYEINQYINEAEGAQDSPPLTHFMRANWHISHFWVQKQEAMDAYLRYLSAMTSKACLRRDYNRIDEAKRIIQAKLVRP